jgi:cyclopropane-fatty-acyl-phospholipid synthase
MINRLSKSVFLNGLEHLRGGSLRLSAGRAYRFGDPGGDLHAAMVIDNERFFTRELAARDIGIGESYMDGDWTSPDLVTLIRLMLRNLSRVESAGGPLNMVCTITAMFGLAARRLRDNSVRGSRRHIGRHYDLGNEFFRLFLDTRHLLYSCAFYESEHDPLEVAQEQKLERIGAKLRLSPDDRLLEIGSGWGGFAVWAAVRYGCSVTTTTISEAQYRHASEWAARLGAAGSRITVLRKDYRELTGRFDKIVSIEMFEAVGLKHYDEYFQTADRLLTDD